MFDVNNKHHAKTKSFKENEKNVNNLIFCDDEKPKKAGRGRRQFSSKKRGKKSSGNDIKNLTHNLLGSISSTFYASLFCTKVFCADFL